MSHSRIAPAVLPAPVLKVDRVSLSFGTTRVLSSFSLTLAAGEVYALLGPNGAGKTTTLNLILGFLTADEGSVSVEGERVDRDPFVARARIAYLPETVMLHPHLTGIESLKYFALLSGHRLSDARARTLLTEAGLQPDAHERRAGTFSKGMRQKVGVAVALAKEARVLLLDEPTSGLDVAAANDLSALVRAASTRGIAVLMASHDLLRVKDLANRVGILRGGRLVTERSTDGLTAIELERLYLEVLAA